MAKEIRDLVELLGITELQAYRHVQARRELARSGYRGNSNWLK